MHQLSQPSVFQTWGLAEEEHWLGWTDTAKVAESGEGGTWAPILLPRRAVKGQALGCESLALRPTRRGYAVHAFPLSA